MPLDSMTDSVRSANEVGAPVPNDQRGLIMGANGRGGAFGFLEVTEDVSQFTRAALFQPGAKTETLVRFSSIAGGELGSADTQRDSRGFALKFYTSQGNYDLVGNNTPVFFIRDPLKFSHFVRSQRQPQPGHPRANEARWDFWTANPESAHQVTWLMGDRGLPKTWRHMNGYGSHTYMWVNASGERFWVKYHFKTDQGTEFHTEPDARAIRDAEPDHYVRDLYEAIERGEHPTWTAYVQVMPYADAPGYRFNPFDLTKVWPHRDYPLIKIGRLVFNTNPENITQIEQAAFEPSNLVPGVGVSPDKMLLGRVFAYADTHRDRIGPNYAQLPVNQPVGSVQPPNPYADPTSTEDPYADHVWEADNELVRSANEPHAEDDDFSQAGALVRDVLDESARARLVANVVRQLGDVSPEIVARAVEYWRRVDKSVGDHVATGVGLIGS